jgi:hypothetical protein
MAATKRPGKAKKRVVKKAVPNRVRRVFGFRTHQAEVRLIEFGGKKRVLRFDRVHSDKTSARKEFIQQKIFHTLFPENSIAPVGIAAIKEQNRKCWGVVSEILRNRSRDYKAYQRLYYETLLTQATADELVAMAPHVKFSDNVGLPLARRIKEQTGISVDLASVNICNVKGKPVFFELWPFKLNVPLLKKYIQANVKDKKPRQMLLKLLNEWLSYPEPA